MTDTAAPVVTETSSDNTAPADDAGSADPGTAESADTSAVAEEASPAPLVTPEQTAQPPQDTVKAKAMAAMMRREANVRKAEAEFNSNRSRVEQELQSKSQHVETMYTRIQQIVEELDKDPIGWLQREKGIGPEEYYHRAVNQGQPSKEEQLRHELKTANQRLDELNNWRKTQDEAAIAARKHAEDTKAAQYAADEKAAVQAAQNEFWSEIERKKAEYPDLAMYPKDVVLKAAADYVTELGPKAENMSYTDVAKLLQQATHEWHNQFRAASEKPSTPPGTNAAQAASPPPAAKSGKAETSPMAKRRREAGKFATDAVTTGTLNNDLGSARASAKVAKTWEEEIQSLKAELEKSGAQVEGTG